MRRRAENGIPPLSEEKVASSVALLSLPAAVVCTTVAFDDDPPVNEEVDAADAVDPDLYLHRAADASQQQSGDAL